MNAHTKLIRVGASSDAPFGATSPPIFQTATFAQESAEAFGRYDYARSGNPTREALEERCALLDRGVAAFAFASGLAAITAVTRLLRPNDELLAHEDCYGGSYRLFSRVCAERGMSVRYANLVDGAAPIAARTRLVFVEALTNPLLRIPDIRVLARRAHEQGALLCVDATALSPWLIRPIELGADLVVHSATKLLSGHADTTAGIVVAASHDVAEELRFLQNAEGAVLGPFDSWLVMRGMQTLGVRLDRQQATAERVATWLARRAGIARVRYPAGVVISFETGDVRRSVRLVETLKLFSIAVSFGSVASTASLPCRMSHASVPASMRELRALPEDLVRLSIGLEDADDLINDLDRAIKTWEGSAAAPWSVPEVLSRAQGPQQNQTLPAQA